MMVCRRGAVLLLHLQLLLLLAPRLSQAGLPWMLPRQQARALQATRPTRPRHHARALQQDAGPSCTPPLTAEDSRRPYCYVPDTISLQAQHQLRKMHVSVDISPNATPATAQVIRDQALAARAADSAAAITAFFVPGSVRNATLAGVRVMYATPLGFSEAASGGSVILYLHGGFFMRGSCWDHLNVVGPVSKAAGAKVVCVDFPLTPEHAYPAQLDAAMAVYKELTQRQGVKAAKVGLLGDSVGGGLAMAMVLAAARAGLELPGAVGLFSPRVEFGKHGDTFTTLTAVDPILQYERNHFGSAMAYVRGNASLLEDPLVSPVRADWAAPMFKKRRFPAVLMAVGLRDTLLSVTTLLYRKLVAAGMRCVVFSPFEGMWHVFMTWSHNPETRLPEAQVAQQEMGAFLRRHLQDSDACCYSNLLG